MAEILRFEKVSYSYDGERDALKNVDVTIYQGERIAILGNNGAGKSTFFLCANGILKPQTGKIFLDGEELQNVTAYKLEHSADSEGPAELTVKMLVTIGQVASEPKKK